MARKVIDIGTQGNDGTGDSIRDSFRKVNDNFQELYTKLGLAEGVTVISLADTPSSYAGQRRKVLTVNDLESGVVFKGLTAGPGIVINQDDNADEIVLSSEFADIVADETPQLGGNLSARSGGNQFRILDLGTDSVPIEPLYKHEAINKYYADTKISLAGTDALEYKGLDQGGNPIIEPNEDFGKMTGPLVLSRDPVTQDDEDFDGLIAATKRYVDGASYYSRINLYVSNEGNDARDDIAPEKQGRALAYAYRTLEAACKKAEELMLESGQEIGPYQKTLTFNNGLGFCTLSEIATSVDSGAGAVGEPVMSVDTFELTAGGTGYTVGDEVTLRGGTATSITTWRVTEIDEATGAITQARLLRAGLYTVLPGATNIETDTNSTFGLNARFSVTYRVTDINVTNGGSNFGLASVIISGGGGSGAYGRVDVVNGAVVEITVTSSGSGFTSLPTITIELPTFKIDTQGFGTDFTATPGPSRDIREGLFLRGQSSGAIANILAHSGTLDGDDELFDVDIIEGVFEVGERIEYGNPVKTLQISIFVETGIYEENYPIKVPENVSIKGDEFRRTIIRPKRSISASPWVIQNFRRDPVIDGLTVTTQPYGWHYLTDAANPIRPIVDNKGSYRAAAQIVKNNKTFIQEEVIGWIDYQIVNNQAPFTTAFEYDSSICKRDVGLILDSLAFDLRWGGEARIVSSALKYYQNASGLIAINQQLLETTAALNYAKLLVTLCLQGLPPGQLFSNIEQSTDPAFIAETGSVDAVEDLMDQLTAIIAGPGNFNAPKENTELDVFLMNDATMLRNLTVQGHGGFAMVLDPEGQILTKSPYAQVGTVISASNNRQRFAGGLFIDGFVGNVEFTPTSKTTDFLLNVGGLRKRPQAPFSFQIGQDNYRVNYIRNYIFNPAGSTATFVLDESTPFAINVDGSTYQAITAGNRSMLSNDFTQINDMGYGLLATNGGLTEAVGMFTYYCYTAFFALNGGQIRSVGGSSGNGVYALKAEGSDPIEVPITGELDSALSQGATCYAPSGAFANSQDGAFIYVNNYSYVPFNQCELEIDHAGIVARYSIVNVEEGGSLPAGVIKLNFATTAASIGGSSGGLLAVVPDGEPVSIRLKNQFLLSNVSDDIGTRPSTALIFDETPDLVYRVTIFSTGGLPPGVASITLREPYRYGNINVYDPQPAGFGGIGDSQIAVSEISDLNISRITDQEFVWKGTVYSITGYETPADLGQAYGRITITPALVNAVTGLITPPTLFSGAKSGEPGEVTVKISTARFTGHDLLDIGTGSYADTNYPTLVFGEPANPPSQANEVQEVGKGRVFYVSTDQDGTFRVGSFFTVDQGTGIVSFAADLSLSNVDGLGFKRGVQVSEFSTDDSMNDNATDTVPTELAVRRYIDRRLGLSHSGATLADAVVIPANTGGFVALNGALAMKGNLNLDTTNRIIGLADPVNDRDGVNKQWHTIDNLQDGTLTTPSDADLVAFTGTGTEFVNGTLTGDVTISRTGNTLTSAITAGSIIDADVNATAEIAQSKLNLDLATTRSASPIGTDAQKQAASGVASFSNAEFNITDGFVELLTSTSTNTGVGPEKLEWIASRTVLANDDINPNEVTAVTMQSVVNLGGAIKKSQFGQNGSSTGYLKRTGAGQANDSDYSTVADDTAATADTLVLRDSTGSFSATQINVSTLAIDSKVAVDTVAQAGDDTGTINLYAYRGTGGILLGDGAQSTDKINYYDNDLHYFRSQNGLLGGTIRVVNLTTGGTGTSGTLTGIWNVQTSSQIVLQASAVLNAKLGTLESTTLTTGGVGVTGTITGSWDMSGTSSLTFGSGGDLDVSLGTLTSTSLTTGDSLTSGSLTGAWSLSTGSTLLPGSGTIYASVANTVALEPIEAENDIQYITFTDESSGNQRIRTDTGFTYNPSTNTVNASFFNGSFAGNIEGNADTVTNGVYTVGDQTIDGVKTFSEVISGEISSVTNGVYTVGDQTIDGVKTFSEVIQGEASSVTNGVYTTGDQTIDGTKTFNNTISGNINGNAATITNQANSATITADSANTAETIVLRDASGNFSANVITGTATAARYADLAERYEADKEYRPGTVVVFGGEKEITQSNKLMDHRVAGVISTNPAHLMNAEAGDDATHPPVALVGRVPCRVVGKIQKGDMLTTSNIAGVAIANNSPAVGTVIGKALENYDNDHIGMIEIVVGRA